MYYLSAWRRYGLLKQAAEPRILNWVKAGFPVEKRNCHVLMLVDRRYRQGFIGSMGYISRTGTLSIAPCPRKKSLPHVFIENQLLMQNHCPIIAP